MRDIAHAEYETERQRTIPVRAAHTIRNCFRYLWEVFPLGTIRLPLFQNGRDSYSNKFFKIAGCFLLFIFAMYSIYQVANFGEIEDVFVDFQEFKSNDALSKKYPSTKYTSFANLPQVQLYNDDDSHMENFDYCKHMEPLAPNESFFYRLEFLYQVPEGHADRDQNGYRTFSVTGKLACNFKGGVYMQNHKYAFFTLPSDIRILILELLENQYEGSRKVVSKDVQAFRAEHGIPRDVEVYMGNIEFIINSRKICELLNGTEVGHAFVTNKQHINMQYRAKYIKPPIEYLLKNYRMYSFEDDMNHNLCAMDLSKTHFIEVFLQK